MYPEQFLLFIFGHCPGLRTTTSGFRNTAAWVFSFRTSGLCNLPESRSWQLRVYFACEQARTKQRHTQAADEHRPGSPTNGGKGKATAKPQGAGQQPAWLLPGYPIGIGLQQPTTRQSPS